MDVTRNSSLINGLARKKRARYSFIVAQLSEKAKDYKRAVEYYKKTIKLKIHEYRNREAEIWIRKKSQNKKFVNTETVEAETWIKEK